MAFDNKGYDHNLQIINKNNTEIKATFKVRIADDQKSRNKGLMFVKDLPQSYGMLFIFDEEKIINMWMKSTLISLDMVFIDKNDVIVKIVGSAPPLSKNIISSDYPAIKVLELNSGTARSVKLDIGDKIFLKN